MPVAQRDIAAAVLGDLRVVGHEYDGTSLGMQFLEKNQYLERGTGIEISGRFIGEDDGGVVYQRPGDGDTLHLSSGHLVAFMHQAVAQTYGNQRFDCFLVSFGCTVGRIVHQGQLHVLDRCRLRQQVVVLEDEPDFAVAQGGAGVLTHRADRCAVEVIFSAGRCIQAT